MSAEGQWKCEPSFRLMCALLPDRDNTSLNGMEKDMVGLCCMCSTHCPCRG